MKLVSKVSEIYCIADDFCKEYELELNKKALSLSNPSPNTPKTRNRKGRALTKANVDDRNPEVFNHLPKDLFGKLYADKGYISQSLFASLFDRGVHIVTGIRSNMKNRLMDVYDKIMLVKEALSRPSTICSRT